MILKLRLSAFCSVAVIGLNFTEAFHTLSNRESKPKPLLVGLFPKHSKLGFETSSRQTLSSQLFSSDSSSGDWNGEVVSNDENGKIMGCSILKVDGSQTEYEVTIDGVEADLGKFSEAIYKKITNDAKQQRFQGFRPGTIPPHLVPTYVSFAMDECAREATLEALAQNDIRPFESTRMEMTFENVSIPPVIKKKKKKKGGRNKKKLSSNNIESSGTSDVVEEPKWETYSTMKEALNAGWKPGQSFSFDAKNINGQKVSNQNVVGAKALGAGGSYFDSNDVSLN